MLVKRLVVGPLATNCYVVARKAGAAAAVIDPGAEAERIVVEAADEDLRVVYVIDTHGHSDHVGGNRQVLEATGASLAIHEADASMLEDPVANISAFVGGHVDSPPPTVLLHDGDKLDVDGLELCVSHTPGHTPGSIVILAGDALFTGDTLFAGSVGRTDLPGGSSRELAESLATKIVPLNSGITVYPGHGESSTIGREKMVNPFLQGGM